MTREEKKEEAIKRMKYLEMFGPIIKDFEKNDEIMVSLPPLWACYYLNDDILKKVKEIEDKYNILVYHAIETYTEFGQLLNLLYVSDYKEEWAQDNNMLKENLTVAYVINLDNEPFSEFGSIMIKTASSGGLKRIY